MSEVIFSHVEDPNTWDDGDVVDFCIPCPVPRHDRLPMFYVVEDDEPDGFPWPYRKDGRANQWYRREVEAMASAPELMGR